MTNPLTARQRAHLRSLAHGLKPVVHIGTGGVTDDVIRAVEEALSSRELLKVKVLQSAPRRARETADEIRDSLEGVHVPQTIGRTIVLYRPFEDHPEIELPK